MRLAARFGKQSSTLALGERHIIDVDRRY